MKTTILFILLSFPFLQKHIPPKILIYSHSNYNDQNGIACVVYNQKLYCMEWFGNPVSKEKQWKINEVDECTFGGPNSTFQEDFKDSEDAINEIQKQLLKIRKLPVPPE